MAGKATTAAEVSRRRIIKRPRLTRMLDESGARIIMLVAPAGYGKTTLAHEWLEGKRATWYRASPASADVAALAAGLARAAAEIVPGAGKRMRQRLRATDRPEEDAQILAEMLAEDLADWATDAWLIIDDYQFAMDSSVCEEFVEALLDQANPLALIASRRRPRWATARRRLYGNVFEIDRTVLAMDTGEATQLLSKRTDAAALLGQAAGWPAVIGLAALAGSQQATTPAKVPTTLYDYFAEELLQDVPDEERIALCQVAVIPSITDSAAVHLLGRDLARETLAKGVDHGLLQRGPRDQYEVHPLLRAFLQERLITTGRNVPATVTTVGDFLLTNEQWDDALALARQFRIPAFLDAFIESAWEPLLDEGRLATLASLVDFAAELRVRSVLLDLVEAEIAFRQGSYRKAETLAVEATRWLNDDHLLVQAHVRAGQSAHLEGREEEAIAHHRAAHKVAISSSDRREALWGEFVCATELESDGCAALLEQLESLGADNPTDSIRLASGRMLWAIRSGTGIHPGLFSAVHTLPRVDDPLVRSSFLHVWGSLLIYTGRYEEALEVTDQQVGELRQNRLEFALPLTFVNEALALRGLRRFRESLKSLRQADSEGLTNSRVLVASNTVRIGVHLARGNFLRALEVPVQADSGSVAPNVLAEFMATRALALACAGRAEALDSADEARSLSATSETAVVSELAMAIAALGNGQTGGKGEPSTNRALLAVRQTSHFDAFVTAYRGCPALLDRAASPETLGSELVAIVTRANDILLATKVLPALAIPSAVRRDLLSERETEVLGLVAQGLRNQDIAERLFISEVTVKAHMRSIMRKLGARSRTHAVALFDFGD
jgi:ATP/maltotriose-dependent transcriptional regulator MalT